MANKPTATNIPDLEDPNTYLLMIKWRIEEAEERLRIANAALAKYLEAMKIDLP